MDFLPTWLWGAKSALYIVEQEPWRFELVPGCQTIHQTWHVEPDTLLLSWFLHRYRCYCVQPWDRLTCDLVATGRAQRLEKLPPLQAGDMVLVLERYNFRFSVIKVVPFRPPEPPAAA